MKIVIVKIYEAFFEMFDIVVIGRLFYYGRVLSFRRDRGVVIRILNGVRIARMCLFKIIFFLVRIGGEVIGIIDVG